MTLIWTNYTEALDVLTTTNVSLPVLHFHLGGLFLAWGKGLGHFLSLDKLVATVQLLLKELDGFTSCITLTTFLHVVQRLNDCKVAVASDQTSIQTTINVVEPEHSSKLLAQ